MSATTQPSAEVTPGYRGTIAAANPISGGDPSTQTGSHNLVLGNGQAWTSYGGAVMGRNNSITSAYATVTGSGQPSTTLTLAASRRSADRSSDSAT